MKDRILTQIKAIINNTTQLNYAKHLSKAFGASLIIALFAVLLTNLLYQKKESSNRGYKVEIIKDNPNKVKIRKIGSKADPVISASRNIDIMALIETADLKKGKKTFKKCAACHKVEKGAGSKIGPNLYGVIGRNKGSINGFKYSDALKSKGGKWNYKDLNIFLTKPKDFIPGTKMAFAGLKKDQDRANIIAYLKSANK
jgi:cytochrome c